MPNSVTPALDIQFTSADLHQLYVDLKNVEGNLRVELRHAMSALAAPLVSAVKQEASWSSRIPGAVRPKTSFAAKSAGLSVSVNSKTAPEARPLEHKGQGGNFRHPVFGDRTTWVAQPARPFFWAAVKSQDRVTDQAMTDVMDAVARKAGFK